MVYIIEDYYENSAKKTEEVLERNKDYFQSLSNITNIVVIGHSLSSVDEPYFKEIINSNTNKDNISWYFSYPSSNNLRNIMNFASKINIDYKNIRVFKAED